MDGVFFKMDENLNLVSYYILDIMKILGIEPASRALKMFNQATTPTAEYFGVVGYLSQMAYFENGIF